MSITLFLFCFLLAFSFAWKRGRRQRKEQARNKTQKQNKKERTRPSFDSFNQVECAVRTTTSGNIIFVSCFFLFFFLPTFNHLFGQTHTQRGYYLYVCVNIYGIRGVRGGDRRERQGERGAWKLLIGGSLRRRPAPPRGQNQDFWILPVVSLTW